MQRAEALMEIIHDRGKRGLPLERLHRHLFLAELAVSGGRGRIGVARCP